MKVTLTVHVPLGATVAPLAHVPVPAFEKFEELVPVIVKYGVAITCGEELVFVTVIVRGELVVPTVCAENTAGDGEKESVGCPATRGCG